MIWLDSTVFKHGILIGWVVDAIHTKQFHDPKSETDEIIQNLLTRPVPSLKTVDQLDKVLAIQVESMDYELLNGFPGVTMPFLTVVSSKVGVEFLEPNHGVSGSSGTDFQLLTGARPLFPYPVYDSLAIKSIDTLPKRLQAAGIPTYAYHNNTGRFWKRASAYKAMGVAAFDDISIIPRHRNSSWGLADEDIVTHLLVKQRVRPAKSLHFWITMSTHSPYNLVEGIPPGYYSSFRYLDHQIQRLVSGLSDQRIAFVIYGDHRSPEHRQYWPSSEVFTVERPKPLQTLLLRR